MPGILCEHCTAVCCRYIALPIELPETREDFDDIRWYLLHEGISIFVEDGTWYIYIETNCRHLEADHRCNIYKTRPRICREYTEDNCDYHSGDYGWEQHFTRPEQLDAFVKQHFAKSRKQKTRRSAGANGRRSGVRVKIPRRRSKAAGGPAADTTDSRGVPLPILGNGK